MSALLRASVVAVVFASLALAQDAGPERAFYRGNDHFEGQRYEEAIAAYDAALDEGYDGLALRFNLGCASLYAGRTGEALFHFRLAQILAPRDADVAANVEIARERVSETGEAGELPSFLQALLAPHRKSTTKEAFWIFVLAWFAGMLLLHLRVLWRSVWFTRIALLLLAIGLLFFLSLAARSLGMGERLEGVILGGSADVFTGPSDTAYSIYFELPDGAEVEVLEEEAGWVKISVDEDRRGYVPASRIGILR